jgi:RNA polymerase sigma-70 factor (ECF subfamily)
MMQALQSQTDLAPNTASQTLERRVEEFQDAGSRHLPMLHKRAYRYLGNSNDVEDAVQDALLSAYKHLDQFKGSAKMTTWLTSIVTNSALTQLRRRPRHSHTSLDEPLALDQNSSVSDRLVDERPSAEDECATSELHEHLMQIVGELSPSLRKAIQLRDFEEMSTSEAAEILGVPEGTIKSWVSRARLRLKWRAKIGMLARS